MLCNSSNVEMAFKTVIQLSPGLLYKTTNQQYQLKCWHFANYEYYAVSIVIPKNL